MPITDRDSDARAEPLSASAERIVNDLGQAIAEIGEGASQGDIDGCLGKALERSAHGWNTIPWGVPGECHEKLVVVITREHSLRQLLADAAKHVVNQCQCTKLVMFVLTRDFQSWPTELARFQNAMEIFTPGLKTETRVLGSMKAVPVWDQDISLQTVAACISQIAVTDPQDRRDPRPKFITRQIRKLLSRTRPNLLPSTLNAQIQSHINKLRNRNVIELDANQSRERNRIFRVSDASTLSTIAGGIHTPEITSRLIISPVDQRIDDLSEKMNRLYIKLDAIKDILGR